MRHGQKWKTVPSFSADEYVKQLLRIYEGAEQQCFALIAKYGTRGRDAPDWLVRRTGALQRIKREVQQIVNQLDGQSGDLVRRAVEKAYREGWSAAISELAELGEAGMAIRPSIEAIAQLAQTAVDAVQATHLRILRETMNLAQQILGAGAQDVLQGSLRAATAQTVGEAMAGTLTRRTASQLLLDRIADSGITGFVDRAGRAWQLSSYVEMAVRSATAQATIQGQMNAYAERGHDLVIVSDSPEECKKCRYWEGKVLSISGQTHGYPSVDMAVNSGLFHPNCTHRLHLYVEGMTVPPKRTPNKVGYDDRMKQRYMERQVRKWKRREAMAMDDAARAKARANVKEWQGKLREFTKAKGRPRLYYREQLMGARPVPTGKVPPAPASRPRRDR